MRDFTYEEVKCDKHFVYTQELESPHNVYRSTEGEGNMFP